MASGSREPFPWGSNVRALRPVVASQQVDKFFVVAQIEARGLSNCWSSATGW